MRCRTHFTYSATPAVQTASCVPARSLLYLDVYLASSAAQHTVLFTPLSFVLPVWWRRIISALFSQWLISRRARTDSRTFGLDAHPVRFQCLIQSYKRPSRLTDLLVDWLTDCSFYLSVKHHDWFPALMGLLDTALVSISNKIPTITSMIAKWLNKTKRNKTYKKRDTYK